MRASQYATLYDKLRVDHRCVGLLAEGTPIPPDAFVSCSVSYTSEGTCILLHCTVHDEIDDSCLFVC